MDAKHYRHQYAWWYCLSNSNKLNVICVFFSSNPTQHVYLYNCSVIPGSLIFDYFISTRWICHSCNRVQYEQWAKILILAKKINMNCIQMFTGSIQCGIRSYSGGIRFPNIQQWCRFMSLSTTEYFNGDQWREWMVYASFLHL